MTPFPKETATPDRMAQNDHDLLVELRTSTTENFHYIREDIKRLADGTHAQLNDHETRLRNLESTTVLDSTYSPAHAALIKQIDSIKKYIWMGMGVVSVLVVVINIGIRFIK